MTKRIRRKPHKEVKNDLGEVMEGIMRSGERQRELRRYYLSQVAGMDEDYPIGLTDKFLELVDKVNSHSQLMRPDAPVLFKDEDQVDEVIGYLYDLRSEIMDRLEEYNQYVVQESGQQVTLQPEQKGMQRYMRIRGFDLDISIPVSSRQWDEMKDAGIEILEEEL